MSKALHYISPNTVLSTSPNERTYRMHQMTYNVLLRNKNYFQSEILLLFYYNYMQIQDGAF